MWFVASVRVLDSSGLCFNRVVCSFNPNCYNCYYIICWWSFWIESAISLQHHCSAHQDSHLVTIESKSEDFFLQDYAKRLFKNGQSVLLYISFNFSFGIVLSIILLQNVAKDKHDDVKSDNLNSFQSTCDLLICDMFKLMIVATTIPISGWVLQTNL